jgi:aquaporin Z
MRGKALLDDHNQIADSLCNFLVVAQEGCMQKVSLQNFLVRFWLVFGGCGSAVLAAAFPSWGSVLSASPFAFGLTVLTMAYAVGGISGGHFNPAVSVGLTLPASCPPAVCFLYRRAGAWRDRRGRGSLCRRQRQGGFELGGFAANGYGEHSPGGFRCFRRW